MPRRQDGTHLSSIVKLAQSSPEKDVWTFPSMLYIWHPLRALHASIDCVSASDSFSALIHDYHGHAAFCVRAHGAAGHAAIVMCITSSRVLQHGEFVLRPSPADAAWLQSASMAMRRQQERGHVSKSIVVVSMLKPILAHADMPFLQVFSGLLQHCGKPLRMSSQLGRICRCLGIDNVRPLRQA